MRRGGAGVRDASGRLASSPRRTGSGADAARACGRSLLLRALPLSAAASSFGAPKSRRSASSTAERAASLGFLVLGLVAMLFDASRPYSKQHRPPSRTSRSGKHALNYRDESWRLLRHARSPVSQYPCSVSDRIHRSGVASTLPLSHPNGTLMAGEQENRLGEKAIAGRRVGGFRRVDIAWATVPADRRLQEFPGNGLIPAISPEAVNDILRIRARLPIRRKPGVGGSSTVGQYSWLPVR